MTSSDMCLDHTLSTFTPLDHSQLNDMRRRVVKNEEVSDEELKYAIQTLLYEEREKDLKLAAKGKKNPTKEKEAPIDPSINFDDLMNTSL